MYSFIIVGSLLLFVISEKTFLHFSRTARRAFWYLLSCAVGLWLVKWLQNVEGVGMMWVFLSAVLAASVVEDEVVKKSGLTPMNIEATQRLRAATRTPEAQGKAECIMDIVASVTRGKGYTAGTKQLYSRVSGATKRLQRKLHTILDSSAPQELNYILCAVNMAATVEVASDETMTLLVYAKMPLLTTVARAALVDGLQKLGLRHRPRRQEWARDVILTTRGLNLTLFKAYIDDGGDYHTMYKLVYNDLQGDAQRQVLDHLLKEGAALAAAVQDSGPDAPPGVVLKVLSDIDDTVFSSGDSFPAGVDARYPRKCYYPGALALYTALDRCFARKHAALLQAMAAQIDSDDSSDESQEEDSTFLPQPFERREASPARSFPCPPLETLETFSPTTSNSFWGDSSAPMTARSQIPECPVETLTLHRACAPMFAHHQEGSNLVFLSARPESYKGYTESESYRKYFQPGVLRGELDNSPTMLLGSLDSGPKALYRLLAGRWYLTDQGPNPKTATAALYQTLAAKKLSRFREYAAIYPEACFVFVGDNGQGDVLCAEILYSSAAQAAAATATTTASPRPSQLIASFIHRVVSAASTLSMVRSAGGDKEAWEVAWKQRRIYFHRSHVGMAVEAFNLGLLDADGLHQVVLCATADFRRISGRYAERSIGKNLGRAARHLNKDLSSANAKLPSHLQVSLVKVPIASSNVSEREDARSDITGLAPMH